MIPRTTLPDGETVPELGQGTRRMAEDPLRRADEIRALRQGLDLGMGLIDTAGDDAGGAAEKLVSEAIAGRRDEVFLVTRTCPRSDPATEIARACGASLRRLGTDRIDLFLLQGRGNLPLSEAVAALEALRDAGDIRHWGVSGFTLAQMQELIAAGGGRCAANQLLHNLAHRAGETDLLPWMAARGMAAMAWGPVGQGLLAADPRLERLGGSMGLSATQLALAWVLNRPGMVAIPKSGRAEHVRLNRRGAELGLTPEILTELDSIFPAPCAPVSFEMI